MLIFDCSHWSIEWVMLLLFFLFLLWSCDGGHVKKVSLVTEKISVLKVVKIDLKVVKIIMTTSITSATPDSSDLGKWYSTSEWKNFSNKSCQDWSESCKNHHDDLELNHFGHSWHLGSGKMVLVSENISVIKVVKIDYKVVKNTMTTSNSITSAILDTMDLSEGC